MRKIFICLFAMFCFLEFEANAFEILQEFKFPIDDVFNDCCMNVSLNDNDTILVSNRHRSYISDENSNLQLLYKHPLGSEENNNNPFFNYYFKKINNNNILIGFDNEESLPVFWTPTYGSQEVFLKLFIPKAGSRNVHFVDINGKNEILGYFCFPNNYIKNDGIFIYKDGCIHEFDLGEDLRALITSSVRISVEREASDVTTDDEVIASAIAKEAGVTDECLAADRKLTEEVTKADLSKYSKDYIVIPISINDEGCVLGLVFFFRQARKDLPPNILFIKQGSTFHPILADKIGKPYSSFVKMNNKNQILMNFDGNSYIWDDENGCHLIAENFKSLDINDSGEVIGTKRCWEEITTIPGLTHLTLTYSTLKNPEFILINSKGRFNISDFFSSMHIQASCVALNNKGHIAVVGKKKEISKDGRNEFSLYAYLIKI